MITPQKDTDILVLLKLNDTDLVKVCSLNHRYRNICNDDDFWRLKVVNYVGKDQEIRNANLDPDESVIIIDYETIENTKKLLEFPTWKEYYNLFRIDIQTVSEYYIFLLRNRVNIYHFYRMRNFDNRNKFTGRLPDWINVDKFYIEYKRTSFKKEQRYATGDMLDKLSSMLFNIPR